METAIEEDSSLETIQDGDISTQSNFIVNPCTGFRRVHIHSEPVAAAPRKHKNVEVERCGGIKTQAHSVHLVGLAAFWDANVRQRDPLLRGGVAHHVVELVVVVWTR